ncbi:MAG: HTTM domain-containing protein [Myxococcales bacterium]|nr:HTTM domain-containing protein [Myxococcales bacterium]
METEPRVARLRALAREPVSAASLAALRVIFGLVCFGSSLRFLSRGWVDALYVRPTHLIAYWGFEWLPRPSSQGLYALFGAMLASSLAVVFGAWARAALCVYALCFTWIELLDRSNYLNHYYFVTLFAVMLACLPVSARLSLDARRRPRLARAEIPRWMLWIPQAQIGLVYFFAGVAKLEVDWLVRAEPLRTWLTARAELPLVGPWLTTPLAAYAMSWSGAVFDLTIPFLLLARRTRVPAYLAVISFHAITGMLFNIGVFPWVMVGVTTVFFDPRWPERWMRSRAPAPSRGEGALPSRLATAVIAGYFTVQALLPLRVYAYPGDARWTEQGFRFGWRVMVMEKAGDVRFRVREPATGREWTVLPGEFLSPTQARVIAGTPDMILAAAHILRDEFAARGVRDAQVYADAWASLHRRRSRRLVDPSVDLARERDTLAPYRWVYPDPDTAPSL